MKFLSGFLTALVVILLGGWLYLKFGSLPVAVADAAFPLEAKIVRQPLNARIDREMEKAPFAATEASYEAGAKIYAEDCAVCHGTPGHDVGYAQWMYPHAPQLWKAHNHGSTKIVGVSDDDAGETFWKVKNGIRLTGMPSFQHILNDEQMWDVTLLVKAADQPLSPQVQTLLAGK